MDAQPVTIGVAGGELFGQASNNHPEQGPQCGDLRVHNDFGLTTAADGELLGSADGGVGGVITVNVADADGDVHVQDPAGLLGGLVGGAHHSGRHDAGSSSRRGAGLFGPEEFGGDGGRTDEASPVAAAFAPPACERARPVQPMGAREHAIVQYPAAAAIHLAAAHRARGGAPPMRLPAALLAMLLGAMVIVGQPDAPWPRQLVAFLIWLGGCVSLFLPGRL
ncbi:hypothetical protein E2562_002711 [Oryza meyeriana var. granulata]|uniref:Uncharacterized protein n=1 Tax=Oryza meyeriana var. granulata TaxID=110450 RepID=A0A6G1BQP6_9ORYZ|nr:hypothetical protein E2562_002711 [Oryza meyeriana var. granulata]